MVLPALLSAKHKGDTTTTFGGVAQLGEHLPCKQGVMGSNPIISTIGTRVPTGTYVPIPEVMPIENNAQSAGFVNNFVVVSYSLARNS